MELRRKTVLRGVRIFLLLTIVGVVIIFYLTGSKKTWQVLREFNLWYLLLASLLIVVDLFAGAARIHIFLRRMNPGGSFRTCFKANLANIFLAAATPFQTGGGVAQIFVLNYYGVPYPAGVTVSVLNFVATLSLLFFTATVVLTAIPGQFIQGQTLLMVLDVSRLAFYFTLILFLLFMVRPGGFGRVVKFILRRLERILPSRQETWNRWEKKVLGFLAEYQRYISYYWREGKMILFWNYVLTIILYFNKCLVAYVILRGMGIEPDFWQVVMLQMLIIFFLYFAPTPGASLIAETGMSAVMSLILPVYLLSPFTVLWRFFTTYFGVLLGSMVLLRLLALPRPEPREVPDSKGTK